MILIVSMKESGLMDRLEGYNTNGHEYRVSQIDRSNSKRLKWMLSEAEKKVKSVDNSSEKNNTFSNNVKNIFNPSNINKVNRFNSSNIFNNKK